MKDNLLSITRKQVEDLAALQRVIKAVPTRRVGRRQPLDAGADTARHWFDVVRPALEKAQFSKESMEAFSRRFDDLLRASTGKPVKVAYLQAVAGILGHTVSKSSIRLKSVHSLRRQGLASRPTLKACPLPKATTSMKRRDAFHVVALRACVVLGWCATVARIHDKIEEIGFAKFNKATEEMAAKTTGRFKPYNKKFLVKSLSELQRVFDTELLWVLEYLELIDSNQHQRLRHCFDMRNHSAHPGLAPISGENLYSFFSDITKFVLKNPKFELRPKT